MSNRHILENSLVDHLPYIRRVVGKVAKNCDVVDDLSQEVCVRILLVKEKLWNKNTDQLSTWMNSIATAGDGSNFRDPTQPLLFINDVKSKSSLPFTNLNGIEMKGAIREVDS